MACAQNMPVGFRGRGRLRGESRCKDSAKFLQACPYLLLQCNLLGVSVLQSGFLFTYLPLGAFGLGLGPRALPANSGALRENRRPQQQVYESEQ